MLYFNKNNGGFYDDEIHEVIPDGSMAITDALYDELMEGQSAGKQIFVKQDGSPGLRPHKPSRDAVWDDENAAWVEQLDAILAAKKDRLAAYRWEVTRTGISNCGGYYLFNDAEARSRLNEALQGLAALGEAAPANFTFKDAYGNWQEVAVSEVSGWLNMLVMTEALYAFPAEKNVIEALEAMELATLKEANVEEMLDNILSVQLNANADTCAVPVKYIVEA